MNCHDFEIKILKYIIIRDLKMSKQARGAKLVFSEVGDPLEVLKLEYDTIPEPNSDEVLLQMLLASVNPVDINMIQGVYAMQLELPGIPGIEGVGRVLKVGSNVKNFQYGDHVIHTKSTGVWRTYLVVSEENIFKVPNDLGLPEAATLAMNPPTVYRMLKDFVDLKPGDTIIQNGANSSCGILAIQMCRIWGIVSVNLVRNRPDIEELKIYLKKLGANYVYTEEEIADIDIFKTGKAARPLLALNCVGGKYAVSIMRHLDMGGVMVTYGGMSMQPITVSTSALVFKDLSLHGFSTAKWMINEDNYEDMTKMFNEIISWYKSHKLEVPPYSLVKLENYTDALANTIRKTGMVGKKYVLDFTGITSKI